MTHNIDTIHVDNESVIIHTFGTNTTVEDARKVHTDILLSFPDNKVISVPSDDNIYALDKQSTIEFLESMIKTLRGDSF